MGNYVTTPLIEKQKEVQKEMQKEMVEVQMKNMMLGQERMRRMMIAQQMALTRERLWWLGGIGGFATFGLAGYAARTRTFPTPAIVPLIGYWTACAYQWDFAYGTKPDRINKYTNEILEDPKYWFTPVLPTEVAEVVPKKPDNK